MTDRRRDFLLELMQTAIAAVDAATVLPARLPTPPATGNVVILAAGKAAARMAAVAEHHYVDALGLPPARLAGIAVTRHGYGLPTRHIPVIEAGHPVPDAAGIAATQTALRLARSAGPDDLVLVLLSGGGSANWVAPAPGVSLEEKQALTRALLKSGATIGEINTVRRHLSAIKGGRLAAAASPARLVTLAISDVPGDDPVVIASGPTVPDPTTLADAAAVLARHRLTPSMTIAGALADPANETPKPGDAVFRDSTYDIIARPADALAAATRHAIAAGYEVVNLGDALEGEARDLARDHIARARAAATAGRRVLFLSGGEATVTVRGNGTGGPNQEYVLAAALAANDDPAIAVLAVDTDGTDGGIGRPDDPAGGIALPGLLEKAAALGLNPDTALMENNSAGFLGALGALVETGPTYTNVNDFRAVIVDSIGRDGQ
ncbi:MAG: DUF4147 domain-containing protein [Hyphomicrobiales bacterium]